MVNIANSRITRSQKVGIALSLFGAMCLCLAACGSQPESGTTPANAQASRPSPRSTPLAHSGPKGIEPDSDESRGHDDEDKSDDNEDSDTDAKTFHGYPCTIDCSGHEAGYKWAEEPGIDDPDDCGGNSESFIEGCRAWAEENR